MTAKFPGIVGPSYTTTAIPVDCQRSINWMPESIESEFAKSKYVLKPTPGFTHLQFRYREGDDTTTIYDTLPTRFPGRIRGFHYTTKGFFNQVPGALVVVAAESVFEIYPVSSDGVNEIRKIGEVSNLEGQVSITDDGFGMIISDNTTLYRCELETSEFTSLGTDAPLNASSVTFLSGYTICSGQADGVPQNTFFFSNQYDNSVWGALDYYSAEGFADPITTVKQVGGNLWLFGPRSYEVWSLTGSSDSPFIRVAGSFGNIGSAAPLAVAEIADKVFFLGNGTQGNNMAWMSNGFNVQPISTDAMHEEWQQYSSFQDAIGYTYSQEGHIFWVVTFLTDNKTWVYDLQNGSWHERASRDAGLDVQNRWKAVQGIYAYNNIYVGDLEGTAVYLLSPDVYTEDGNQIVRLRRTPHISHQEKLVMHRSIIIDVETGVGLASGQGSNPQIMLRYSNDAGRTWSAEDWQSLGIQGSYKTRCKWRRLGVARDRVYELYFSDPVPAVIIDAWVDMASSKAGL